eukprot:TRINITY_DN1977_c0_g3_i1.p1 TRINITY_DN1977_c0_g3~~TRINITY_DN1977_c0_g3_i1.p1  ORF type:complete len:333 (+),score=55.37 TRINITY_DN1977_c0_g3_i1:65-1063(+)
MEPGDGDGEVGAEAFRAAFGGGEGRAADVGQLLRLISAIPTATYWRALQREFAAEEGGDLVALLEDELPGRDLRRAREQLASRGIPWAPAAPPASCGEGASPVPPPPPAAGNGAAPSGRRVSAQRRPRTAASRAAAAARAAAAGDAAATGTPQRELGTPRRAGASPRHFSPSGPEGVSRSSEPTGSRRGGRRRGESLEQLRQMAFREAGTVHALQRELAACRNAVRLDAKKAAAAQRRARLQQEDARELQQRNRELCEGVAQWVDTVEPVVSSLSATSSLWIERMGPAASGSIGQRVLSELLVTNQQILAKLRSLRNVGEHAPERGGTTPAP